ncbi:hypothetical protein ACWIE7_10960 [Dietzia sp. NPDC055343]
MTRMTPAQYVAGTKNATGGGAATPTSTSGVQMPTPEKEDMMSNTTPARPWLDEATALHLTDADLAKLDDQFAQWPEDHAASLGIDLVEYLRDCAAYAAKVRMIIGTDEIPLPNFSTVDRHSQWELDEHETDVFRTVTAQYVDVDSLNATLEADQYAVSGRLDLRVYIEEGGTNDPERLRQWATDLLAVADRWTEIKEAQA